MHGFLSNMEQIFSEDFNHMCFSFTVFEAAASEVMLVWHFLTEQIKALTSEGTHLDSSRALLAGFFAAFPVWLFSSHLGSYSGTHSLPRSTEAGRQFREANEPIPGQNKHLWNSHIYWRANAKEKFHRLKQLCFSGNDEL